MKKFFGTATVLLGMFIAAMESLIGSTIMPSILSSLGGIHLYPLLASSFLLALVVTTPLFGKLCDRWGFTKVYQLAILFFAIGSFLCAMSPTMLALIAARFVQGIGSAGLITLCLIYIGIAYPIHIRHKMQALISSMWVIASVVGPAAGTFFVAYLSWRWAFWINIPFCILISLATLFLLGHLKKDPTHHPFDIKGALLFTLSSLGILFALTEFGRMEFSIPILLLFIVSISLLFYALYDSKNKKEPFLDLKILKRENHLIFSLGIGFLTGAFLFTIASLLPLYIQGAQGKPVSAVGTVVMGMVLGTSIGSIFTALFLNRLGFAYDSTIGSIFIAIGLIALSLITLSTPSLWIAAANFITGFGLGISANAAIVSSQYHSSEHDIGTNTSLFSFFRGVGGMVFISLIGSIQLTLFHFGKAIDPEELKLIFDPAQRMSITPDQLSLFSESFGHSITISLTLLIPFSLLHLYCSLNMPNARPQRQREVEKEGK